MAGPSSAPPQPRTEARSFGARALDVVERVGNALPDPAALFVIALLLVWVASALLAGTPFEVPSKSGPVARQVVDQLSGPALAAFFSDMVQTFTSFHPLGVVLVALLGVGVSEHSGFVNAVLKWMLSFTPKALLTPVVIFVGILSHAAADAGYVLVIPLGGVIFAAAGRHPIAGICAAFAGVSGGFSANPFPSSLDPLLQGITQEATKILDPARSVNPLCNWYFTGAASFFITGLGWLVTDKLVEPRLAKVPVDGDPADRPVMGESTPAERRGMWAGIAALVTGVVLVVLAAAPATSPLRSPNGGLTDNAAPLMKMIVPLIFVLFLLPGLAHGFVSGTYKSHRDVVKSMTKSMSTMGYYLVMAFFAALFIYAFNKSQIGALLAVNGANALKTLMLPGEVTIIGIIVLCGLINLLIGSASAKWALLAPILVPMLMQLGLSPELTQAAFRVGDSTTNIITPLMPYFPLVVAFAQRYVKGTGIGTLTSLMLPYTFVFMAGWTLFLLAFWALDIPLGIGAVYTYP